MGPKFELPLNGTRYALSFNLGAWAAVRRRGEKITDLLGRFDDPDDFDALQVLLWAMCWDNPHPPSPEDIGRLVTYGNVQEVRRQILAVMQDSLPEPKAGASEEARPTASGTGTNANAPPTVLSDSPPANSPS